MVGLRPDDVFRPVYKDRAEGLVQASQAPSVRGGQVRPLGSIWSVARAQTLVQLTDELLQLLDERAARERRSRSTLIREALEHYLSDDLQAELDRRIVDGYRRVPQTDDEDAWAEANARAAIREEPW
jgi:predicted DNA-binding protein